MVLVFDLDGVIYLGDTPFPQAIETVRELSETHPIYYLTNNSTRSRDHYGDKLTAMGLPTDPGQVVTSAYATGLYLQSVGAQGKTVYVVGEKGLREEMRIAGLRVINDEPQAKADYVVAGLDRTLDYNKLAAAHEHIQAGATFIATNRDRTYPMETGQIPGGGAMVVFLEWSTGVNAPTIGKPEAHPWQRILALAEIEPSQALMVGDRPETDIRGAKRVGLWTALVLTGVTPAEAVPGLPEDQRADFVLETMRDLPAAIAAAESQTREPQPAD